MKRMLSMLLAVAMLVAMIPGLAIEAMAAIQVEDLATAEAGYTASVTCGGLSNADRTNLNISPDGYMIGVATLYDAEGGIISQTRIAGSDSELYTMLTGGQKLVTEVYLGKAVISGNYTFAAPTAVEVTENGKKPDPLITTNITHAYLNAGETVDLRISSVAPGFYAEVDDEYTGDGFWYGYDSSDENVATVDSKGVITAVGPGRTAISMVYKFGFSSTQYVRFAHTCYVTVLNDYGLSEAYANYYAEGNDKYFNIVVPGEEMERSTGFDIQVGDEVHNTGDDYQMLITFPDDYSGDVVVSKEGYLSNTLKNEYISSYNWVILQPKNPDGQPVIQSVLGHPVSDSQWYNLRVRSMNLYEETPDEYEIHVDVNWGKKTRREVWIQQGDVTVPVVNGTTGPVALGTTFRNSGEPVYVCASTADGVVVKSQILVNVFSPEKYARLDFGDTPEKARGSGLSATYTGDTDVLQNQSFSIDLSGMIPFEYSIDENGKVKGTLGVTTTVREDNFTYYDHIKETIHSVKVLNEETQYNSKNQKIQDLADLITDDGGIIASNQASFGVSCQVSFLGYVEGQMVDGRLSVTQIDMVCMLKGEASLSVQSFCTPYYWSGKIAAQLENYLHSEGRDESGDFPVRIPATRLTISVEVGAYLGPKYAENLVKAGVRLIGSLDIYKEKVGSLTSSVWTLSARFEPVVNVLGFDQTGGDMWDSVVNWQIFPYEDPETSSPLIPLADVGQYTQMARAPERAVFAANTAAQTVADGTDQTIVSNAYAGSSLQAVRLDGQQVLVWLADMPERTDENRTCVYYSVYDESEQRWSEPAAVLDDGLADHEPVLQCVDGQVFLLWSKASEQFAQGAALSEVSSKMDIWYAAFDAQTGTFTGVSNVSGVNGVFDAEPRAVVTDAGVQVVWRQNSANDYFGQNGTNTILAATLTETGWENEVLAEDLKTISGLTACASNGALKVYFSADTDEDYFTSDDVELFAIESGTLTRLTDNTVSDMQPRYDGGRLYWLADGVLTDGSDSADIPFGDGDVQILDLPDGSGRVILYVMGEGLTNNLYASINDGSGWGEPVAVTALESSYITEFSGYFAGNALMVAAACTDVDEDQQLGQHRIIRCSKTFGADLGLSDAVYAVHTLVEGGLLQNTVTVTNSGTATVDGYRIDACDSQGSVLVNYFFDDPILPGASAQVQIPCLVSDVPADGLVLRVKADGLTDIRADNDETLLSVGMCDVSMEGAFAQVGPAGETTVTAFAVNRGMAALSGVELTFRRGSADGEILGTATVEGIETGASEMVSFTIAEDLTGSVIYVCAAEQEQENIYSNNVDFAIAEGSGGLVPADEIVLPASIEDGPVQPGQAYYLTAEEGSAVYTAEFTPEESGHYLVRVEQYGFSGYPSAYNISLDADVWLENGELEERISEDRYETIRRYYYLMEAGETYTFEFTCNDGCTAQVTFIKALQPESLTISPETMILTEGADWESLKVQLLPRESYGKISYTSSDERVAVVDGIGTGYVTPRLPGQATITVAVEGTDLSAQCQVTVVEREMEALEAGVDYADPAEGYYTFSPEKSGFYTVTYEGWTECYDSAWNWLSYGEYFYCAAGDRVQIRIEAYDEGASLLRIDPLTALEAGVNRTAQITEPGAYAYFSFTAPEDGRYAFYSVSDSDTQAYLYDETGEELAYNDDGNIDSNFCIKQMLKAGQTCLLAACYYSYNKTGSFEVAVEQIPYITAMEVKSMPDRTEYVKGFVSEYLDLSGLEVLITWSDGTTSVWKENNGGPVGDDWMEYDCDAVDDTGVVRLHCAGAEADVVLTLIDNPVESLQIVQGTAGIYVEHYGGYFDTHINAETGEEEECFRYYTHYPDDALIRVNYTDGTSRTVAPGQYLDGYDVFWDDHQDVQPWVVGTDNVSVVSYLGVTCVLPITVITNPVAAIEVVSGGVIPCIENAYGWEDSRYDEDTDEWVDYYLYDYRMYEDTRVKITYTDGTTRVAAIDEAVDGFYISIDDDQWEDPWTLGDENEVIVEYLGVTTRIPVSVIANPLESITLIAAPTRTYTFGDLQTGMMNSNGNYYIFKYDMTGLKVAMNYTDGTSRTVTWEELGTEYLLDDYDWNVAASAYFLSEPGEIELEFRYMGRTVPFSVTVGASPVASMEVVRGPDVTTCTDLFHPDFLGLELKINYTDGTTKNVTATRENLVYGYGCDGMNLAQGIRVDDSANGVIWFAAIYDGLTAWTAVHWGAVCPIDTLTVTEAPEVDEVELEHVCGNGDGMTVRVTYADGTADTLTLDTVFSTQWGDGLYCMAMTEKGLVTYEIYEQTGSGNTTVYGVRIFGEYVEVESDETVETGVVKFTQASISLAGDIGVNYYAQLSGDIVADPGAYMQFTVAGQTQVVPLREAVVNTDANGVTTYRFSCKVAAKQMTEAITGQMYLGDGTAVGEAKVYSVKAYCDAAIPVYSQYAAYADLVKLMEAMLNYGGYSQTHFGYNTANLANAGLDTTLPAITADDVAAYAHGATGSESGISVASVSLLLESTTTIRFYFNLDGSRSIDDYTFYVDGAKTAPVESNGQYYVDKVNVAAKDLDEMVTVTVGGLTAKYCGLSYVRQVAVLYPSYYNAKLVNVAKALYAYNQAANAYFG